MINAVIDISHHNGSSLNFAKARADGILGIIHKATQGLSMCDPMFPANRSKAGAAGLLWGAYHFGTCEDGNQQADHFLSTVGDTRQTLLVLDFEPDPAGPAMTLAQARDFVTHVAVKTGRYPGLYSGNLVKQLLGSHRDPVLAQCWLWLAQYGPVPATLPNWPTWTMWQYTDGAVGPRPHDVAGIGLCDRDMFNGDEAHLRKLWGAA